MAIDLGSEFMKVAIVKPGVPMEIALDSESSRKTPTVVTMRNDERLFGGAALNMAVKFPSLAYQYIPLLIGKSTNHPDVQEFLKNFPYYNVKDNEKNGQLVFLHDGDKTFTAEEILSMLLEKAKETAEKHSGFPVKSAVITIPPYFTQASRRALLRAASHCDLTVLQLMTEGAAVALNYGVFRIKSFNATAQHIMFYDMGANSATATIVEYRTVMHKEFGMAEETPQLTVLGVGYDTKLGTVPLALRLRDHLATKFNALGKTPGKDVRTNPRAMAKLFREALRVIKVLSANQHTLAQVENVMDEVDLKAQVARSEFEEICADLFARVEKPIRQAVEMAQLPMSYIKEVILMGGGTRIPKVQEVLLKVSEKTELGKGINSDEAAALGAVYQAAALSPGFRVKRFLVKDGNLFPIQVTFPKAATEEQKLVTRTVFRLLNNFSQKKSLTFNKHVEDFSFNVHHGELDHLSEEDQLVVNKNLSTVHLKGVSAIFKRHMPTESSGSANENQVKVESKGIKAHFELNSNGIYQLNSVEALFEKTKPAPAKSETEEKTQESTESKEEAKQDDTSKKTEKASTESATTKPPSTAVKNATTSTPPKPELISEAIDFVIVHHDAPIPSDRSMKSSAAKIKKLRELDEAKRALEKSRNELEAFIFEMRDRLSQETYEKASTAEERESLTRTVNEVSDWYDEAGFETTKKEFDDKLKVLKSSMSEVDMRVRELNERPQAFAKLKDALNHTQTMYALIQNFSGEGKVFTATEMQVLKKALDETQTWMKNKEAESKTMSLTTKPTVTLDEITAKRKSLEREIQYLLNKLDIWKSLPPPPPPPKEPKSKTSETNKTKSDDTEKATPELPTVEDKQAERSESKEETSKPQDSTAQSQKPDDPTQRTEL